LYDFVINSKSPHRQVLPTPTHEDFPFSRQTYQRDKTIMKAFKCAIAIMAIAVLAGCEYSELRPIPVSLPIGGEPAPVVPAQPSPLITPKPIAPAQIDIDFEGLDYVWAGNNLEAVRKCLAVAELYRRRGRPLKVKTVEHAAGRRWRCIFEEEST
jgi:hypothetical protein